MLWPPLAISTLILLSYVLLMFIHFYQLCTEYRNCMIYKIFSFVQNPELEKQVFKHMTVYRYNMLILFTAIQSLLVSEKNLLSAGMTSGRCWLRNLRKLCWLYLYPSSAFSGTAVLRFALLILHFKIQSNSVSYLD